MIDIELPPFVAHRLLRGGNLQTIAASLFRAPAEPDGTVLRFARTTMQDRIALHRNVPAGREQCVNESGQRVVLMLHGLAGCHRSAYMVRCCRALLDAGFIVYRMDARGAGAGAAHARYHNHAGRSEDMQAAVDFVASQHPLAHITVVGFSLGANILLNWLGRSDSRIAAQVDSAVAVAPPIELAACANSLKTGLSRFYDTHFSKVVMRRLKTRRQKRPDMVDFPVFRSPEKLSQFDVQFTAPAGGFASVDDYYDQASSARVLGAISTPTLLLVDRDDPVIPIEMFRRVRLSDSIFLHETSGGGHLGYVSRRDQDPDRYWMTWRIVDAVKAFQSKSQWRDLAIGRPAIGQRKVIARSVSG